MTTFLGTERPGQDQPVEALGYVATLGSPPGLHRRARSSGPAPSARSSGPRSSATTGDCSSSSSSIPAKPTAPGSTGPRCRRAREVLGLPADRAVRARGPGAGRGRPGRAPALPRRPAGARRPRGYAGVRADYDRVLKQRNALLQTASGRRSRSAGRRTTVAPWTSGTPTCRPRRGAARRPARAWSTRCARAGQGLRRGGGGTGSGRCPVLLGAGGATRRVRVPPRARPRRPAGRRSDVAEAELAGGRARGLAWSARTATTSRLHPDDIVCARRPAGQGLRQSRRVLVVRAGAPPGVLRPAAGATGGEPVLVLDDVFAELDDRPPGPLGRAGRAGRAGPRHRRGRRRTCPPLLRGPLRGAHGRGDRRVRATARRSQLTVQLRSWPT